MSISTAGSMTSILGVAPDGEKPVECQATVERAQAATAARQPAVLS
jgi:hypothetical protein